MERLQEVARRRSCKLKLVNKNEKIRKARINN
jgi:hypothetical protein